MYHSENSLWAVLLPLLQKAVVNMPGVLVERAFTPTVQHGGNVPRLAVHRAASRRYGTQGTGQEWRIDDEGNGRMIETAIWRKEDTYRLYAYSPRQPHDDGYTAKDLLEAAAANLQGRESIEALRQHGIGILRMTDIVETPFLDAGEQHEFGQHIDVILTYTQTVEREIPVATRIERKVYRI